MFQYGKAAAAVDRVFDHIASAEAIAEGKHPRMEEVNPILINYFQQGKEMLLRFRREV